MQYLAICEDDLLFQFMRNVATEQGDVLYLVPTANIAQRIKRQLVKFGWRPFKRRDLQEINCTMSLRRGFCP